MNMSKFLDIIEAFTPVSRTMPRASPGANAPMQVSKVGTLRAGAGMSPREVHELRDFLSQNGINSFLGGPTQPDVLKIKLDDNKEIIVKVLPEEDGESNVMPQIDNISKDTESRVQQPALQVKTAYRSLEPQIVKAGQEELRRTQDVLKDQSKRMKV